MKKRTRIIIYIILIIEIIAIGLCIYKFVKEPKSTVIYDNNINNELQENNTVNLNNLNNVLENNTAEDIVVTIGVYDITSKFLNGEDIYLHGIITKIENNKLYFKDKDNKEYSLENNENIKYIDGRTAYNYSFNEIKNNYYIEVDSFSKYCYIYKNITGEELKKELLINLVLPEEVNMTRTSVNDLTEVEQLGNDEAILTFNISDLVSSNYFPDVNDEEHKFDIKLKVTKDTKYNSKFPIGNPYNINTLEEAKNEAMFYIEINSNTLDKKYPEISEFDAYSN